MTFEFFQRTEGWLCSLFTIPFLSKTPQQCLVHQNIHETIAFVQ